MADDNQRQYFADVVERLRREGDLGRNGKNSFKTVKDTLKEESINSRRQSQMENNIASSERRELINTFSGIVKNEDGEITVTDYSGQLTEIITKMDGLITGIEGFSKTIIQENGNLLNSGKLDGAENKRESKTQAKNQLKVLQQIQKNTAAGGKGGLGGSLKGLGDMGKGLGSGAKDILEGVGGGISSIFMGMGKGILFAGAGIAAVALSIVAIMRSFDEMAEGLQKLNELELDPEVFNSIGNAIGSLVKELGMGNAIGLKILSGVAFDDLGAGLEKLNNLKFNPEGIENLGLTLSALGDNTGIFDSKGIQMLGDVDFDAIADGITRLNGMASSVSPEEFGLIGEAINNLLSPLSAGDIGEAQVLSMVADKVTPEFADSIRLLGQLGTDEKFEDEMASLGKGLDNLITPFGLLDTDNMLVINSLAKGLPSLAQGVSGFTGFDAEVFKKNATLVGEGLQGLLDGTDDLFGAGGLQMIDDNIRPLATAVSGFTGIVDDNTAESFRKSSKIVGDGLQDLLDGTDDLFGAVGLQAIDDNILPLAEGVKKFTDIVTDPMAESFRKSSKILGQGFADLLDGTDDLFGATGLQAIDDNLMPFADGVSAINTAGANLDLANFTQIGLAIDEVNKLSDALKEVDFSPMEEVELPVRKLHAFASDLQTLMKGIAFGGEHDFEGLGMMGFNDDLDFGEGFLKADLQVDNVLSKVQKIHEAISAVQGISSEQVEKPITPAKQQQGEELEKTNREVSENKSEGSNVVSTVAVGGSTTNNNSQTVALTNNNHATQDGNDRSWSLWG